jgi:hypothetical protein
MNVELLAASALLVYWFKVAPYWSFIKNFCNCPKLSQPKSSVQQQAAKVFQQHWRHLKGNYDLINLPLKKPTDY